MGKGQPTCAKNDENGSPLSQAKIQISRETEAKILNNQKKKITMTSTTMAFVAQGSTVVLILRSTIYDRKMRKFQAYRASAIYHQPWHISRSVGLFEQTAVDQKVLLLPMLHYYSTGASDQSSM
jgi:hypothetical protein